MTTIGRPMAAGETGGDPMDRTVGTGDGRIASASPDRNIVDRACAAPDPASGCSSSNGVEIDDVLNDPTLPLAERRARLEGLLGRVGDEDPAERDGSYVPLDMRITDALAMLAEGGHDYGASGLDPEAEDVAHKRLDDIEAR